MNDESTRRVNGQKCDSGLDTHEKVGNLRLAIPLLFYI